VFLLAGSVIAAVLTAERNGRAALEDLQLAQLQQLARVLDGAFAPALTSKAGLTNPANGQPWKLTDADPTDEAPRRVRRPKRTRSSQGARPTMAPRNERQFRQTVVKVDLWSVTKLSLCFYLSAMFVTLVALIALWVIADAAGVIGSIEKFLGELLSAEKGTFQFLSAEVLRGTILIGLVVVALQVVVTVVAASFYNIFSELFGGLEITVKEEETSPRN
jgi:hypothetical protein